MPNTQEKQAWRFPNSKPSLLPKGLFIFLLCLTFAISLIVFFIAAQGNLLILAGLLLGSVLLSLLLSLVSGLFLLQDYRSNYVLFNQEGINFKPLTKLLPNFRPGKRLVLAWQDILTLNFGLPNIPQTLNPELTSQTGLVPLKITFLEIITQNQERYQLEDYTKLPNLDQLYQMLSLYRPDIAEKMAPALESYKLWNSQLEIISLS